MSLRYDVLKTPVVTEKSTFVKDNLHTLTFSRQGRYSGHRPDWKKAYVTLRKGEKMVEFAGAV